MENLVARRRSVSQQTAPLIPRRLDRPDFRLQMADVDRLYVSGFGTKDRTSEWILTGGGGGGDGGGFRKPTGSIPAYQNWSQGSNGYEGNQDVAAATGGVPPSSKLDPNSKPFSPRSKTNGGEYEIRRNHFNLMTN